MKQNQEFNWYVKLSKTRFFTMDIVCWAWFFLKKRFNIGVFSEIITREKHAGVFYWSFDMLNREGKKIISMIKKNKNFSSAIMKEFLIYKKDILSFSKNIEKKKLENLDKSKLDKLFNDFIELYYKAIGFLTLSEPFEYIAEKIFEDKLSKKFKKEELTKYIAIIASPTQSSFIQEENIDLLKIAQKIKNKKLNKKEALKNKEINKLLDNHAKKYHWISDNYEQVVYLNKEHFLNNSFELIKKYKEPLQKIKEIKKVLNENKANKKKLLNKIKMGEEFNILVNNFDEFIHLRDLRKELNTKCFQYMEIFVKAYAKKFKMPLEDAYKLSSDELITGKFDRTLAEIRDKNYLVFIKDYKKIEKEYFGEEAKRKAIEFGLVQKRENELNGTVASIGKGNVKGFVRILYSAKEIHLFKKDEILVVGKTDPSFVPAMERAAAIITDEGGLTCHAAIVSREMNKPCIIGTKLGTRTFKTGDYVEVDVKKGVIKIIK